MLLKVFPHTASVTLDYYIDWGPWLAGDTLVTSEWMPTGGIVFTRDAAILGDLTQIWAGEGIVGELIDLNNHIITAEGREEIGTLRLIMRA